MINDFKKAFAVAKSCETSVMECNQMDDYFHLSTMEVHSHLSDFVEFAVRAGKACDLAALEEVGMHVKNLLGLVNEMHCRIDRLTTAVKIEDEKAIALKTARATLVLRCDTLVELMESELGLEIDESE